MPSITIYLPNPYLLLFVACGSIPVATFLNWIRRRSVDLPGVARCEVPEVRCVRKSPTSSKNSLARRCEITPEQARGHDEYLISRILKFQEIFSKMPTNTVDERSSVNAFLDHLRKMVVQMPGYDDKSSGSKRVRFREMVQKPDSDDESTGSKRDGFRETVVQKPECKDKLAGSTKLSDLDKLMRDLHAYLIRKRLESQLKREKERREETISSDIAMYDFEGKCMDVVASMAGIKDCMDDKLKGGVYPQIQKTLATLVESGGDESYCASSDDEL